jgi:hypothetical protein
MFLHVGLGCGEFTGLVVGGVFQRKEYILAGPPLAQIGVAEPLAEKCQTVCSPEAWAGDAISFLLLVRCFTFRSMCKDLRLVV